MAWYTYDRLRSHNCIMSFVLSNRGGGKTYGAKIIGIKDWIKGFVNGEPEQFVYVRRLVTEFDTINQFFDDVINNEEFENYEVKDKKGNKIKASYEFKVEGMKGFIRPKVAEDEEPNEWNVLCYFIPLSVANKYKSTPYPKVTKIFFDEVIIDTTGNQRYLKNEERILMELLSTIIRKRSGVKFFGMANNVSLVNPHFIFWKIKVDPNKRFSKSPNGKVVVELFTDSDFIKEMEQTEFGALIAETDYGRYAIHNESLCDDTKFIKPRPKKNLLYKCGFVIEGHEIHAWYDPDELEYYIDKTGIGSTNKNIYAITTQDHTPDISSIKTIKDKPLTRHIKLHFQHSSCYYSDLAVQQHFLNLIKYI